MSVLNQSGEELVECPLCMEPLEVDDLNFFPCSCGYQICRFCWHRIRTDENGLCPACRKVYSENPAGFIPLTQEQMAKLKAEKRQREQQRKAKLSESRKHLSNVRVVQKNLVFVVGLPPRLADVEVLKRHEYFGKFGKIHKVVINQSTAYAGSQGPSASAYVTYVRSEDALKAIQSVNNIAMEGRTIKSSLGTTKYCSHFMKNQVCPKPDCMYLHDFGDPKASFTKDQMHAGKHQEYEKKLHESLLNKISLQNNISQQGNDSKNGKNKDVNTKSTHNTSSSTTNKENWPQLSPEKTEKNEKKDGKEKSQRNKSKVKNSNESKRHEKVKNTENHLSSSCSSSSSSSSTSSNTSISSGSSISSSSSSNGCSGGSAKSVSSEASTEGNVSKTFEDPSCNQDDYDKKSESGLSRISSTVDDNSSFFSQNSFQKVQTIEEVGDTQEEEFITDSGLANSQILNDTLPSINSAEDWEAAFGFVKNSCQEEYSCKQRGDVKDTLEVFGNNYNRLDTFTNIDNTFQNNFESNKVLRDNFADSLLNKQQTIGSSANGYVPNVTYANLADKLHRLEIGGQLNNGYNSNLNTLDHQMSKFFTDFYVHKNGQKDNIGMNTNGMNTLQHNGLNQIANSYLNNLVDKQNLLMYQQKQFEEQLLKYQNYNQQVLQHNTNGFRNAHVYNNTSEQNYNGINNHIYQTSLNKNIKSRPEDELDFDPFHETQKGLAELLDSETERRSTCQAVGVSQYSSLNHTHVPPPPPGFVQSTAHMNSFGSKILPYLNMGNSQQHHQPQQQQQQQTQQLNGIAQNNWSNVFSQNHQQQKVPQSVCNDWKMLDPAIVSSSRNFMITNPQTCDFSNVPQPLMAQQLQSGSSSNRSLDFQNFSNYTVQPPLQNNYNNFTHTQQNFNWLSNELNSSQIATPPGFRASNQTTKQQEC